jgi:hypothetical protein
VGGRAEGIKGSVMNKMRDDGRENSKERIVGLRFTPEEYAILNANGKPVYCRRLRYCS